MHDRGQLPAERSLDVIFPEYVADELGAVERVYALSDTPLTEHAREAIDRYKAEHAPGRYGRMRYDFAADFGLDPDEVRRRFAFYLEKWPNVVSRREPLEGTAKWTS